MKTFLGQPIAKKITIKIKTRHARLIEHTMRKNNLEHLVTTGNIEGKRSMGRQ